MNWPVGVVAGALAVAGTLACGSAVVSRRRRAPASTLFTAFAGAMGVGALALAVGVVVEGVPRLVVSAAIVLSLVLPVPWLLFALEYTGRSELVTANTVAVLSGPGIAGVAATGLFFVSELIPWFTIPSQEAATGLFAVGVAVVSLVQWLGLLYAGGLVIVATGLLLSTFHQYDQLDETSGTLIGVLGIVPWLLLVLGFRIWDMNAFVSSVTTAIGLSVGGVAASTLVGPCRLFTTVPAAGNIGPATVIEELEDIVIVTNSERTVVELNTAAREALDADATEAIGRDVSDLLDLSLSAVRETDTVSLQSGSGRQLFEPTVSELTDQNDYCLGYAIVLRDVTARTTRQERLEVFNRVLRHNLGNKLTVIIGHAELLRESADDAVRTSADAILRGGRDMKRLSEQAREIERLMDATQSDEQVPLAPLVRGVADAVRDAHPEAVVEVDVPEGVVVSGPKQLLQPVLANLVENAVVHNDGDRPRVTMSASYDPGRTYSLELSVEDDGPGLPDPEREAVLRGEETPLEHGSGLGLWMVRWSVTRLGGEIDIDHREPRGTVVSIRLSQADRAEVESARRATELTDVG